MLAWLNRAVSADLLRPVDVQFARRMLALSPTADPYLLLAAALVSHRVGQGDVCLPLDTCAELPLFREPSVGDSIPPPDSRAWADALLSSGIVARPGERAPLVLDDERRLYLARYWHFEQRLAGHLLGRVGVWQQDVDRGLLRAGLDRLFPLAAGTRETDWQRVAAALAVLRPLCVISGGPGTGKTFTVTSILALLVEQAGDGLPRVALAAPTGKAAARLTESIAKQKQTLDVAPAVRAGIPEEALTLHRLLGFRPGRANPRHGPEDPLHLDVLVIDEASMVDLPLMARALEALPPHARLILLGDRNQLASVEAGMVMGDICGRGRPLAFGAETRDVLNALDCAPPAGKADPATVSGGLADHVVELTKTWRFDAQGGIRALSEAVNAGRGEDGVAILRDPACPEVELLEQSPECLRAYIRNTLVPAFGEVTAAPDPRAALSALARMRVLCAVREGVYGVGAVNTLIAEELEAAGLIRPDGPLYAGRPVMIRVNDHIQRLYNGDVGLILRDPEAGGAPRVWFETADGMRRILPARLPPHETVYAMTVHKSQGSEFDHVVLVLPEGESRVVTRELLYTGITRASRRVSVMSLPERFCEASARNVQTIDGPA